MRFKLLLVFVEDDKTDKVIEAAREAGATGCTIINNARGEGIDANTLTRLTDPFFTTRREKGGTGLGLAISDRIVKDHGGSMTFHSAPGKGTTVRVTFPLASQGSRKT